MSSQPLRDPKKFARRELGVRKARTDSSPGADWKSSPGELFGLPETILTDVGADGCQAVDDNLTSNAPAAASDPQRLASSLKGWASRDSVTVVTVFYLAPNNKMRHPACGCLFFLVAIAYFPAILLMMVAMSATSTTPSWFTSQASPLLPRVNSNVATSLSK